MAVACTVTPTEKLNTPDGALNPESKYALMWIKPCQSKFLGGCDPDDGRSTEAKLAIHSTSEFVDLKTLYEEDVTLSASIARINASDIVQDHFLRNFRQALSARQLDVVAVENPIHQGALQKTASTTVTFDDITTIGATQFPLQVEANTYKFSPVYQQLDADYLIVMELLRFSIDRYFGPTGKPTANPLAVSAVRVYLHESATGNVLFDDYAYNAVELGDAWNKPPHYQSLADSLELSLKAAINEARNNLLDQ